MTKEERQELNARFLHKEVDVIIDRPIGYHHVKNSKTIVYPINYGYISGVLGGDEEELDVYVIGVDEPIQTFHGKVIAVAIRENDVEDKLIACPLNKNYSLDEIKSFVAFREKDYISHIEM